MNETRTEFSVIQGITIYTGATKEMREQHANTAKYLDALVPPEEQMFTPLKPSTLTAQGLMTNINFIESEIIDMLLPPTGPIMLIGCNYGEYINPNYKPKVVVKTSGRGRKPKPKAPSKRKTQGTGKYFSSQITFFIQHPSSSTLYKIKLFRNGVFQVPGIKEPSMEDLIEPIVILRDYLAKNFAEDVQIVNFMGVMRNYKARLIDLKLRVDLESLETYINSLKSHHNMAPFIHYSLKGLPDASKKRALKYIGKYNIMSIAEVVYNTDRCFSLIVKFYRPIPGDTTKKTTVKLLKKGKINFDGANSEAEVLELYYWLRYIYYTLSKDVLIDVSEIHNHYNPDDLVGLDRDDFIYDPSESEDESDSNDDLSDEETPVKKKVSTKTTKICKKPTVRTKKLVKRPTRGDSSKDDERLIMDKLQE
jgi:hypothetical protein